MAAKVKKATAGGSLLPGVENEKPAAAVGWQKLLNRRLLLTDKLSRIACNEWSLIELAPAGNFGKFRNEIVGTVFWHELNAVLVIDDLGAAVSDVPQGVAQTMTFIQDDGDGALLFERTTDKVNIRDPDRQWKDSYSLTIASAHDLKRWLERVLSA